MEIRKLDGFDFVDCIFLEFAVHPLLSNIMLKIEAYFPEFVSREQRKRSILKITLEGITELQTSVTPAFCQDLEANEDYKANEVYEVKLDMSDQPYSFSLASDYLTLSAKCQHVLLEESE